MKTCTKCGLTKNLEDFHVQSASPDGRRPRCKMCVNTDNRKAHKDNPPCPQKKREQALKRKYGLTQACFDTLLAGQDHKCAICGTTEPTGMHNQWHVDHNHETGDVRGILCDSCNRGIGLLQDSHENCLNAAVYLKMAQK